MNSQRYAHAGASLGQIKAAVPIFRAGCNRHERLDARVARALNHRVAISVEVGVAEVAVGIDHVNHLTCTRGIGALKIGGACVLSSAVRPLNICSSPIACSVVSTLRAASSTSLVIRAGSWRITVISLNAVTFDAMRASSNCTYSRFSRDRKS